MENKKYIDAGSLLDTDEELGDILCRLSDFDHKRIQLVACNNKKIKTFWEELSDNRVDTAIYNKIAKKMPKLKEIEKESRLASIKRWVENYFLGKSNHDKDVVILAIQRLPSMLKESIFDYINRINGINNMADKRIYSNQEMQCVQRDFDELYDVFNEICVDLARIVSNLDERYSQPFIPVDVMTFEKKMGKMIKKIVNETTELCGLVDEYYTSYQNAIDLIDNEWDFLSHNVKNISEERESAILKKREQFVKNEDSISRIKQLSDEIRKIIEMELDN